MHPIVRGLAAAAVVVAVAGCGGATTSAQAGGSGTASPATSPSGPPGPASTPDAVRAPSVTASSARPTNSPSVAAGALRVTFETGGGCYDTAEPVGCGEHEAGPVLDAALRAQIVEQAPRLAQVPDGDNGCGDEFVDGVSVRAIIEAEQAELAPIWRICLSNVPEDDPTGRALWQLYEDSRG